MKRSDKEQLVIQLKQKIEGATALYYTDFTGLNVKRMTELRRRFRKAGVEYVVIKNLGSTARSLTGWTVRDAQNHVYKFGTFTLGAHKSVVLRSGKGTNTSATRYWGSGYHIWNNTGDKAYLRTAAGTGMDYCVWTTSGAGYKIC